MSAGGLRIGIIADSLETEAWQANALRRLVDGGATSISLIVVVDNGGAEAREEELRARFLRLCTSALARGFRHGNKKLCDGVIARAHVLKVMAQKASNDEFGFSPDDIAAIRKHNLDFMVSFSSLSLRGDILRSAKHGVWAYSYRNPAAVGFGPAGFWEIYRGTDAITTVLEVLGDEPACKVLLREGHTPTCRFSYAKTMTRAHRNSEKWLRLCADELRVLGKVRSKKIAGSPDAAELSPSVRQFLVFLLLLCRNFIKHLWLKSFYIDQWMVGYARASISTFVEDPTAVSFDWITPSHRTKYMADPFLVEGPRLRIYCEYFDYWRGIGEIVEAREENGFSITDRSTLIGDGTHFSYPFIWSDQDRLVIIPENNVSGKITAYEISAGDGAAVSARHEIIGEGRFTDPTPLFHNGMYWCFATSEEETSSQDLHLFFSETLFGPYQSHPRNPVISDIRSARPAGRPIRVGGRILRPSQDCSSTYGGSLRLNEITELSRESYSEVSVLQVRPEMVGGFPAGCHHIDYTDNFIAIDTKRLVFHPLAWWFRVKIRFGRPSPRVARN